MFKFDPVTFGADIRKLRENGVAVANKQDDVARQALGGLRASVLTQSAITIAALAAHGNPKSPKGKLAETISGLQYAKGGEAARNCLRAVFDIDDNVRVYGNDVPAIGAAIDAYVSKADGAAKGYKALQAAVKALVKTHLEQLDPDQSESEAKAEAENKANDSEPANVFDTIGAMIDYVEGLSADDVNMNQSQLVALMAAITNASQRVAAPLPLAA